MAARGWARLILDRRRDLVDDRPSRATAAAATPGRSAGTPLLRQPHQPLTRRLLPRRSGIAHLPCPVFLLIT